MKRWFFYNLNESQTFAPTNLFIIHNLWPENILYIFVYSRIFINPKCFRFSNKILRAGQNYLKLITTLLANSLPFSDCKIECKSSKENIFTRFFTISSSFYTIQFNFHLFVCLSRCQNFLLKAFSWEYLYVNLHFCWITPALNYKHKLLLKTNTYLIQACYN